VELNIKQAAVSKQERITDLYVSTIHKFINARDGEIEIRARFRNCTHKSV
jgi:hypothetical protein